MALNGEIVGREVELAACERLLERVAEGPAALVVEGEAGIGKTTVWRAGSTRRRDGGLRSWCAGLRRRRHVCPTPGLATCLARSLPGCFRSCPSRSGLP